MIHSEDIYPTSIQEKNLDAENRRLRAERKALRAALFPFLRLDHDIGDEWREDCERARTAYGNITAR
jgi:hypothetical protein